MNVIVVVIDTLRYDYVGPEGTAPVETPNLDRFAKGAWRFSRAFASSFPTVPARQDMLLGRGGGPFHDWSPLSCDRPTLPGRLAEAGYVTQLIHDTPHLVNGGHAFDYPFQAWTPIRGAECDRPWIADTPELLDSWAFEDRFDGYGIDRSLAGVLDGSKDTIRNYVYAHRDRETPADWNVARLFSTVADFLEDNAQRENFFLWVDCFDPHEPWDAPPEYVAQYDPEAPEGRIDPRSFHEEVYNHPELSPAARSNVRAQYRAKVTFMDRWFGHFLDTLEATGLDESTAVLVMGDHGTNLDDGPAGSRTFGKAHPPAENEAHLPLFLHVPGAGSGVCDAIVQPQDLFGTVAALAGAEVPAGAISQDLLTLAQGEAAPARSIALAGGSVGRWAHDPEGVLCYAYADDWLLGLTADPDDAVLRRYGDLTDRSADHPDVVSTLRDSAIEELANRGLDGSLVRWLRDGGSDPIPADYRSTDVPSSPDWWEPYFANPVPD